MMLPQKESQKQIKSHSIQNSSFFRQKRGFHSETSISKTVQKTTNNLECYKKMYHLLRTKQLSFVFPQTKEICSAVRISKQGVTKDKVVVECSVPAFTRD